MKKDWKRRIAYEVIVILGMLTLLTFICRLWPVIFLCILGIFIAAIRLLFLSSKKVETIEPMLFPLLQEPKPEPTDADVIELAYSVILRQITQFVCRKYPNARWVWEASGAKERILRGEDVFILLNHAGGYRRAMVIISNLQVLGIDYNLKTEKQVNDEDKKDSVIEDEDEPANYDLVAFEWVDAHIVELNARCNDAIGEGIEDLIINSEELPIKDSWPAICKELIKNDLTDVRCINQGIKINLTQ